MFATEAVAGGLPIHIAAKVLGHKNINTTQAYTIPQELHQTGALSQVA
jgi:site-specific recombinase XerD